MKHKHSADEYEYDEPFVQENEEKERSDQECESDESSDEECNESRQQACANSNTITEKMLESFENWLQGVDGGRKEKKQPRIMPREFLPSSIL